MAQKEAVKKSCPCEICGRTDGDFRLLYEEGYTVHWCFRETSDNIFSEGREYIRICQKQTNIAMYSLYMEKNEYEAKRKAEKERWLKEQEARDPNFKKRWVEEQKRKNPNWKPTHQSTIPTSNAVVVPRVVYEPAEEVIVSADRKDEVYRAILKNLILERKHYEKLKEEWGDATKDITSKWGIKSLPPLDYNRVKAYERYDNPFRKNLMENVLAEVGEPKYIPGCYLSPKGSWQLIGMEGIIYPIYDIKGRIIMLRICDDYPEIDGTYNGEKGTLNHKWDEGYHKWFFTPEGSNESVLCGLDLKKKQSGIPYGKAKNKYKYFSSFTEKKDEEQKKMVNAKQFGARASAKPGIYFSEGDSFEIVNATEGEKKSIIANRIMHRPTIALPGVGTWSTLFNKEEDYDGKSLFDILIEKGMKRFVVMYDADKAENERVLHAEQDFINALKTYNIKICVGEWNECWGKGLDDILIQGVIPVEIPVEI